MKKTTIALVLTLFLASCYDKKESQFETQSTQFSIQTDTTYKYVGDKTIRLIKAKNVTLSLCQY
jgi:uncharacterized lipoprotein YehR (DUF1307 family)